jgi:hypothetical protein
MDRSLVNIGSTVVQSVTVSNRWIEHPTEPAEITFITVNPNTPLNTFQRQLTDLQMSPNLSSSMATSPTVRPARAKLVLLPTIMSGNLKITTVNTNYSSLQF